VTRFFYYHSTGCDQKSSLLIIHETPMENKKAGSYYYNFVNNRFELIKTVEWESDMLNK